MTSFSSRLQHTAPLTLTALLALSLILAAGCQTDLAGPENDAAPLVSSVPVETFSFSDEYVAIRVRKPKGVRTSAGKAYQFKIQAALSEEGKARGHASLVDMNAPAHRFQYVFRQGRIVCQAGGDTADDGLFYFLDPSNWEMLIEIVPPLVAPSPLPSRGRSAPARIRWTWIRGDRAGEAGEFFEVEVDHLSISPGICDDR